MPEFMVGFLARIAVMIPVLLIVSGGTWLLLQKLGIMRPDAPFSGQDMRTWPLRYAVAEAALFAVIFAAVSAALGESEFSAAIAGGAAALIAIGGAPILLPKILK